MGENTVEKDTEWFVTFFWANSDVILDNLSRLFIAFGYLPGIDKKDPRVGLIVDMCRKKKARLAPGIAMVKNGKITGRK